MIPAINVFPRNYSYSAYAFLRPWHAGKLFLRFSDRKRREIRGKWRVQRVRVAAATPSRCTVDFVVLRRFRGAFLFRRIIERESRYHIKRRKSVSPLRQFRRRPDKSTCVRARADFQGYTYLFHSAVEKLSKVLVKTSEERFASRSRGHRTMYIPLAHSVSRSDDSARSAVSDKPRLLYIVYALMTYKSAEGGSARVSAAIALPSRRAREPRIRVFPLGNQSRRTKAAVYRFHGKMTMKNMVDYRRARELVDWMCLSVKPIIYSLRKKEEKTEKKEEEKKL